MAKDKKIAKFIKELCSSRNITTKKEFKSKVDAAIYESDEYSDIFIKDETTFYRWMTGATSPEPHMYPFIAKALDVTEEEIRSAKFLPTTKLEQEIDRLTEIKNSNDKETKFIISIIWPNRSLSKYWSALFYIIGIHWWNYSHEYNPLVLALCIICFIISLYLDNKNIAKENYTPSDKFTLKGEIKILIDGFKLLYQFYKKKSLIAYVIILELFIFIFLSILPIIEIAFYRGTCDLSIFLYFIIGTILMIKSFKD